MVCCRGEGQHWRFRAMGRRPREYLKDIRSGEQRTLGGPTAANSPWFGIRKYRICRYSPGAAQGRKNRDCLAAAQLQASRGMSPNQGRRPGDCCVVRKLRIPPKQGASAGNRGEGVERDTCPSKRFAILMPQRKLGGGRNGLLSIVGAIPHNIAGVSPGRVATLGYRAQE